MIIAQEKAIEAFRNIIGNSFDHISDLTLWKAFNESQAWFSHFHHKPNFSLPFVPKEWLFSDIVMVNVNLNRDRKPFAYYKRGISKYRTLIQKGEQFEPITILWGNNRSYEGLGMGDGNHRYRAAWEEHVTEIPAVFGIRKSLLFDI
jgi:hypothetical protein